MPGNTKGNMDGAGVTPIVAGTAAGAESAYIKRLDGDVKTSLHLYVSTPGHKLGIAIRVAALPTPGIRTHVGQRVRGAPAQQTLSQR